MNANIENLLEQRNALINGFICGREGNRGGYKPDDCRARDQLAAIENELREKHDICPCSSCGTMERIHLLDGKPDDPSNPDGCDWNKLECIACYGAGWAPTGGEEDFALSVFQPYRPLYAFWADMRTHLDAMAGQVSAVIEDARALRLTMRLLLTNPHVDLGSLVYKVREAEGLGWDGPQVKAWSAAVVKARELIAPGTDI